MLTILELNGNRLIGAFHQKPRWRVNSLKRHFGMLDARVAVGAGAKAVEYHVPDELHDGEYQLQAQDCVGLSRSGPSS